MQINGEEIKLDLKALPGGYCPWCGQSEERVTPEGRTYNYPPNNCCITRSVHRASIAAEVLDVSKFNPNKAEQVATEEAWQMQLRDAFRYINAQLASSPSPAAIIEKVASDLEGRVYRINVLRQIRERYGHR